MRTFGIFFWSFVLTVAVVGQMHVSSAALTWVLWMVGMVSFGALGSLIFRDTPD